MYFLTGQWLKMPSPGMWTVCASSSSKLFIIFPSTKPQSSFANKRLHSPSGTNWLVFTVQFFY